MPVNVFVLYTLFGNFCYTAIAGIALKRWFIIRACIKPVRAGKKIRLPFRINSDDIFEFLKLINVS